MRLGNLLAQQDTTLVDVMSDIRVFLNIAMIGLLAMIAVAGIILAIWIAIRLAKAEDDGKRKEAKAQLVWAIVGVLAAIVIAVIIPVMFNGLSGVNERILDALDDYALTPAEAFLARQVGELVFAIGDGVAIILQMGALVGVALGVYIAMKLVTATDDSKRKQAKQQLLWTIVGVFGAIIIAQLINTVMYELALGMMREEF